MAAWIFGFLAICPAIAEPLAIDASRQVKPSSIDLGQGTNVDPQGRKLTADSQSLLMDGAAWIPVAGEFHFSRYFSGEWRDELLKMKAGGLDTVSIYFFWIHHEEKKGEFDWSGCRSVRDFLQICQDLDIKVVARIGPWSHGECRNGGFPDWLQSSGIPLRGQDPRYMALVTLYYQQISAQLKGFLWKDGGPVIAVQLDNETPDIAYLLALKKLAIQEGIDVPFYTMTGWNGAIPDKDLVPMNGGYADGFWSDRIYDSFAKWFFFYPQRNDTDIDQNFKDISKLLPKEMRWPYLCCEMGGGMTSSGTRRIRLAPEDVAATAMVRLGDGNNMPGYYLYQGSINPDGATHLNEEGGNPLPVKDYDFGAPLSNTGQVRAHYHLLREQHLFIQDFGSRLARMPAFFPDLRPPNVRDTKTVRWSVRSDGDSGFLFFNNYSRYETMPDHPDIQFSVKTRNGDQLIPDAPITLPAGAFGFWPFNLDCDGVTLEYATAQPLARIEVGSSVWYFFVAQKGIDADFAFASTGAALQALTVNRDRSGTPIRLRHVPPGAAEAFRFVNGNGSSVRFVVLSPEEGRELWRASWRGRDRLFLSKATVLSDKGKLRLQANNRDDLSAKVFPPPPGIGGQEDSLFVTVPVSLAPGEGSAMKAVLHAEGGGKKLNPDADPTKDDSWKEAPIWNLEIPPEAVQRHVLLQIHYAGSAARFYDGDKLVQDNLYNGDPFEVALWRVPADHYNRLRIKILPYAVNHAESYPAELRPALAKVAADGGIGPVDVNLIEQFEVEVP